jgi:uncharacterized protein (DUF2147 family)
MMKKILSTTTLLFTLSMLSPLAMATSAEHSSPLVGVWLTEKKEDESSQAKVEIAPCASKAEQLCGKIIWLEEPIDSETGKPKLDKQNPDKALRDRPIMGVEMLAGFNKETDTHYTGGSIYSPKTGKTYSSELEVKDENKDQLHVTGKVLFFSSTQTWNRVKD